MMKTTLEFIADLKAKFGIESDYAVAKLLNVTRNALSLYRNGKAHFSDEVALHVADLLEIDPAYVVACIHAERAKHAAERNVWERIAQHYATAPLMLIAICTLTYVTYGHIPHPDGLLMAAFTAPSLNTVYYVK